jgi:hypothetical protein
MHEDGLTEHSWKTISVMEQGALMPAWTYCPDCGLSAYALLMDQMVTGLAKASMERPPDVPDAPEGASEPRPRTHAQVTRSFRAANDMNLLFSGVGFDLGRASTLE